MTEKLQTTPELPTGPFTIEEQHAWNGLAARMAQPGAAEIIQRGRRRMRPLPPLSNMEAIARAHAMLDQIGVPPAPTADVVPIRRPSA